MAIKLSLATVKKITLAIIAIIIAVAYYFISYFFCYFLINIGLISAVDSSDNFYNPLAVKIAEITKGDQEKPTVAVATSSDWSNNFEVVSPLDSVSAPTPASTSLPAADTPATSSPDVSVPGPSIAPLSIESSTVAVPPQPDSAPNVSDPALFFGSYFDTFSNNKYVDSAQTTLYYDEIAAAYFFPPDYAFTEIEADVDAADQELLNAVSLNNFEGPYGDKRCLEDRCLEQKGSDLFFENKKLGLPGELSGSNIAAVSIGNLTKRWLVGFTIKNEAGYEGIAYYFDGHDFFRLQTPAPMVSPYFGLLGFGGGENNFLVIYGAYKGIAYHIQGDKISDISRFFDTRVMNGGFKAEVLFTAFETNINWYVYSLTSYRPVLIKLWQNQGPDIAGEMILNSLFQRYDESAVFRLSLADGNAITLLAKLKRSGRDHWFNFRDQGFKNENGGSLVSLPIAHDGYASLITIVKIAKSSLGIDKASVDKEEFSFSADSQQWIKLGNEQNVAISVLATRYFLLKVALPRVSDKFYSPFVSDILFNYYCRK
ncbi:MAG: hypothetical protein WC719_03605 [Patescibacteria group bacterium]|jgi:hypothetical protein